MSLVEEAAFFDSMEAATVDAEVYLREFRVVCPSLPYLPGIGKPVEIENRA
jgi:hypothetical protein